MEKKKILIIGAGVSGLSTGILLLKKGYSVKIWAKDLPPNTTSDKAAAFWYPVFCNPKDKVIKWSKDTLEYLKENVLKDKSSGCFYIKFTDVSEKKLGPPWWEGAIDYQHAQESELPEGYVDGYVLNAVMMDTTFYMPYLVNLFKELGGTIVQKEIKNIDEALENHEIVINCTGLGSKELLNDEKLYPLRAQVIKVKKNGVADAMADEDGSNSLAYILPRKSDIVLGGTAQKSWDDQIDEQDTKDILRKTEALNPSLKGAEIIKISVGFRPARSEVRLEKEMRNGKTLIHNYGHGGSGFTISWGCAMEVVRLVEN